MNVLIKRISDDDGEFCHDDTWHVANPSAETERILCSGEAFDLFSNIKLEFKEVKRGGITCKKCVSIIKEFKSIKL